MRPRCRAGRDRPEFPARGFYLESGALIERAHVTFVTWGRLNAARDNAILLPSWYGGRALSYAFLIGPGRALDPAKYFIVATELFGSGGSSSPSNTPPPFDRARFPRVAIRDNVEASRNVLSGLGVERLHAVVGFSMGAQQGLSVGRQPPPPSRCHRGDLRHGQDVWSRLCAARSAISALTADPRWHGGDFTEFPEDGFKAWSQHWVSWVYSHEWWRQELFRPQYTSVEEVLEDRARTGRNRNLNDAVHLARTWQENDISETKGFDGNIEDALSSLVAPVLYMPCATDLYFPPTDAQYESRFIPKVTFTPIPSLWGHSAGGGGNPADAAFINREIAAFLADM